MFLAGSMGAVPKFKPTLMSPTNLWTTILKLGVWRYGRRHLGGGSCGRSWGRYASLLTSILIGSSRGWCSSDFTTNASWGCFVVYIALSRIIIYKMNLKLCWRRLKTSNANRKLNRKLLTEVINQLRSNLLISLNLSLDTCLTEKCCKTTFHISNVIKSVCRYDRSDGYIMTGSLKNWCRNRKYYNL